MNLPANIRVNASFPFPALVQGSGPITLTKINGIWTIGYNGSALGVINTAPPLTGGPIDLSGGGGAIGLAPSGVVAGSYTNTNLTVNAQGLLTAASNGTGGSGGLNALGAVDFRSFGAVGDGATDNSTAWNNFNTYARAESAAGRGVNLVIPPGTYNYDGSLCNNYFYGIKKLHVIGYGAIIQNTYDSTIHGQNSAFEWAMSPACQVNLFSSTDPTNPIGPLIQTTAIGDTTVMLLNHAFISQFAVGDWVMVSSLDIQYFGFPPNCDNFDLVQITAINAGTGVLTFGSSLTNAHRSDFADGGNPIPCGKARVWQLSSITPWDIDHLYEGIEVRVTINSLVTYMNMSGKSYKILNCIWPGISPSVAKTIEVVGCTLTAQNEPDKLVKSLLIDGTRIQGLLDFQSSSIDCVTIRNCLIELDLSVGQAKQTLVQNCDIAVFTEGSPGGQYGTARGLTLDNCIIHQMPFSSNLNTFAAIPIDGTNVIYDTGVFKVLKTGTQLASFGIALGTMLNLVGPAGFSGNLGTGIVTKISEDATYVLLQTTLPYVTLPSWATGGVWISRQTGYAARNCSGCDPIINQNKLTAQGLPVWTSLDLLMTGWGTQPAGRGTFGFLGDASVGNIVSITVNVIQAYSTGPAQLQLSFGTYLADMSGSRIAYEIDVDLTVAGTRVFTQSALTGAVGTDQVLYNGVAQTTLKSGIWGDGTGEWAYFLNTGNLFPPPTVQFLVQCDPGFIRTLIPAIDMSA